MKSFKGCVNLFKWLKPGCIAIWLLNKALCINLCVCIDSKRTQEVGGHATYPNVLDCFLIEIIGY